MSIMLHWWMVPLGLAVFGSYLLVRPSRGYADIAGTLVGMCLLATSVAICVGYALARVTS
jgi:hypothetical protein